MRTAALVFFAIAVSAASAAAADLTVPDHVTANSAVTVATSGSGSATFYLFGPTHTVKRDIKLGESIQLKPEELRSAGRYLAIIRDGDNSTARWFWVVAGPARKINFLARPSRVPVATSNAISGVAVLMDDYHNVATAPTPVNFSLTINGTQYFQRTLTSRNGIAYAQIDSAKKEGAAQWVASLPDEQVRRVVQQVAGDPCNLRMRASRSERGILVETDPIRDCSGNAVPDGTIVTFTLVDSRGRTTVDSRVKKDVARAELPPSDRGTISVASGVVMGNEITWGGR